MNSMDDRRELLPLIAREDGSLDHFAFVLHSAYAYAPGAHTHCELCWATISNLENPKYLKEGLRCTETGSWICPSWPGTTATDCPNTTYKIVFYKNCAQAKEILGKVDCLSAWTRPFYPQDLAFFKGNQCWFYSVGHEKIAQIIHATDEDISFWEENELASREDAYIPRNNWFDTYNEVILRD